MLLNGPKRIVLRVLPNFANVNIQQIYKSYVSCEIRFSMDVGTKFCRFETVIFIFSKKNFLEMHVWPHVDHNGAMQFYGFMGLLPDT